jgi:UDP-glucose 4-epimerase
LKILITGSSGFIGQRLLKYCKLKNYNVRLLSRKPNNTLETFNCDFENDLIPEKAFTGVDFVIHLAGVAHDLKKGIKVSTYEKVNVIATQRIAQLAKENQIKKLIFISSVKAGGSPQKNTCVSENDQSLPSGIYGKTKRKAELELIKILRNCKTELLILRPTLVYGPEVKGNLELMLRWIQRGFLPPLPNSNNKRSMIHVDDFILAIFHLIEIKEYSNPEIINVSDGCTYSSKETYQLLCKSLNKPLPSWAMPMFLFDLLGCLHPRLNEKLDKIFGDAWYSSEKLFNYGFKPELNLADINKKLF